ncbi:MAG: hypothetical protein ACE5FD_03160 [Anaerolineae bacterium]
MNETDSGYVSYLLRLWQAEDNGVMVWRASLESSQTGQRWTFANMNDLMAFLQTETSKRSKDQVGDEYLPDP